MKIYFEHLFCYISLNLSIFLSISFGDPIPFDTECGHTYFGGHDVHSATSKLIEGKDSIPHSWPWQAVLYFNGEPECGASILTPYWILTAAHCFNGPWMLEEDIPMYKYTMRAGLHKLHVKNEYQVEMKVSRILRHPGFSRRHSKYDIALVRLTTPLMFNEAIQPICLPNTKAESGRKCVSTGWGTTTRGVLDFSETLQQGEMVVIDTEMCKFHMEMIAPLSVGQYSLCSAGLQNTRMSGCHGDSGSPFVCYDGKHWELQGVMSWGSRSCGANENEYTVYASVHYLKEWIIETMTLVGYH
ncbi:chymotrypsinogen B-like [Clytia hemisphaerica]|uniref:Peptidase S1 domain-containing protein n=1 Tax=Clytia hemisphaerica TaxID=252671 RepID=A0A7M6DN64_9CNID|eukprot:TCONS_00016744-protein